MMGDLLLLDFIGELVQQKKKNLHSLSNRSVGAETKVYSAVRSTQGPRIQEKPITLKAGATIWMEVEANSYTTYLQAPLISCLS